MGKGAPLKPYQRLVSCMLIISFIPVKQKAHANNVLWLVLSSMNVPLTLKRDLSQRSVNAETMQYEHTAIFPVRTMSILGLSFVSSKAITSFLCPY